MHKQTFIALILILPIVMTSCGLQFMLDIDFKNYDKIDYKQENGETVLVYQNTEYRETDLFSCSKPQEEVSWHINLPFSGAIYYYSYSTETPLYLWKNFGTEGVWISTNYDYHMDTFVVDKTETEILFCEMIDDENVTDSLINTLNNYYRDPYVVLHSKMAPNLFMQVKFIYHVGVWYMMASPTCAWRLSQEAIILLKNSGII